MVSNNNKCLKCGRALTSIGLDRKNGRTTEDKYNKDWDTRKYHKKCWREKKEHQEFLWKLEGTWPC